MARQSKAPVSDLQPISRSSLLSGTSAETPTNGSAALPAAPEPDAALIAECDQVMSLEKQAGCEADHLERASDKDWHAAIDPIWDKRNQAVDRIETMVAHHARRRPGPHQGPRSPQPDRPQARRARVLLRRWDHWPAARNGAPEREGDGCGLDCRSSYRVQA